MKEIITATMDNIEDESHQGKALVVFSAKWCGPCRTYSGIQQKFIEETDQSIKIIKVDVDEMPEFTATKSIRSVPTTLFLNNGEEELRHTGVLDAEALQMKVTALNSL